MKLIIYTDGASRGNPGPASYGFTITDEDDKLIYEEGKYIGLVTNNVAEYAAVLQALRYLLSRPSALLMTINFYMDSQLVVEQLSGRFKIKSDRLKPLILQIRNLEKAFKSVTYQHIIRDKNKRADQLANRALDSKLKTAN